MTLPVASQADNTASAAQLSHRVAADEAGQRADAVLARASGLSRARVQALIAAGAAGLDGRQLHQVKRRVQAGQALSLAIPAAAPASQPQPEPMALAIHYEDAHLLVLDKPAGLTVHPGAGQASGTLVNALLAHVGEALRAAGDDPQRPGIVHRLDKDTSGLMVVAKTAAAHRGLVAALARRAVSRRYTALVWGWPQPPNGVVEAPIGRDPRQRQRMAVRRDGGGKAARTAYELAAAVGPHAAAVTCTLASGRTHQIRVHLAHLGHPVIGDAVYGRRRAPAGARDAVAARAGRQALHAHGLALTHPITGAELAFDAALPGDLAALRTRLESL